MKHVLLLLLLGTSVLRELQAQAIAPHVVASAGTHSSQGSAQLSWTLGEFMIQTLGTDPILTQGFHQGKFDMQVSTFDPTYAFILTIYPNPTEGILHLKTTPPFAGECKIHDLHGKEIKRCNFYDTEQIDLTDLPQGLYVLHILLDEIVAYTAKIEKF